MLLLVTCHLSLVTLCDSISFHEKPELLSLSRAPRDRQRS